jgi:hypothetical protein
VPESATIYKGVDYPVTKEDLIKYVQKEQEVLPKVLEALKQRGNRGVYRDLTTALPGNFGT